MSEQDALKLINSIFNKNYKKLSEVPTHILLEMTEMVTNKIVEKLNG